MNITVYCGANVGNKKIYQDVTVKLGKWIAENGHTLIYGGGQVGLMGLIADTVLENGGKVIGIIPEFLTKREPLHKHLTELKIVETMAERKALLLELGEACIALPGGTGTLEEITEVYSWARIGKNPNPCVFFNIDGFYEPMKQMYHTVAKAGFMREEDLDKLLFSDDLTQIEKFIANYQAPEFRVY